MRQKGIQSAGMKVEATQASLGQVRHYLEDLQDRICLALEARENGVHFQEEIWQHHEGGGGRTRVMEGGAVWEKAGVNFSQVEVRSLPGAATERRPHLSGRPFHAMGVSLVLHPRNPYVPTTHCNVRYFLAPDPEGTAPEGHWWFGGGFDLTPYYPFLEDVVHWHRTAQSACAPYGPDLYSRCKTACDEYFFLPHRKETRGVGGLFFDDYTSGGWERSFSFLRSVGDAFLPAYLPIVDRRHGIPFGDYERSFQIFRRGRYVEFNLLHDRGTLFGLQSGGRVESILMSLPPLTGWRYNWHPLPDSPEACLADFLRPRDWLSESP